MDKKALDSIGKTPRPGKPECHLMIVLSTAHVTDIEYEYLHTKGRDADLNGAHVDPYYYGVHLIVGDPDDGRWAPTCADTILNYARNLGATHVRLDQDGPVIDALPTYEW